MWHEFRCKEHFGTTASHKAFIVRTWARFRDLFPEVSEESARVHDDSKLDWIEIVGYTDMWVWRNRESKAWKVGKANLKLRDVSGFPV